MPARFELIGDRRYLSDVVRYGDEVAAEPREHRQIPRRRQIGAQESAVTDLQLDSKKCVQDFNGQLFPSRMQLVLASSLRANLIAVDGSDGQVGQLPRYFGCDVLGFDGTNPP